MTEGVLERYTAAEAEAEDVLTMHFAAMRVMDSTRGGGWGTFRVDGLTDDQAERLPSYVAGYEGGWLESVYFDDDGELKIGGRVRIEEGHSKFSQWHAFEDPETGESRRFFRWDRELWDPEAAAVAEHKALVATRKHKAARLGVRLAAAAIGLVEYTGLYLGLKASAEAGALRRSGAPAAQIEAAEEQADRGMELAAGGLCVGMATIAGGLVVMTIQESRKDSQPNKTGV